MTTTSVKFMVNTEQERYKQQSIALQHKWFEKTIETNCMITDV